MDIKIAFNALMRIMQTSFTLYGFTISLWQIVLYLMVAALLLLLIGGLLK